MTRVDGEGELETSDPRSIAHVLNRFSLRGRRTTKREAVQDVDPRSIHKAQAHCDGPSPVKALSRPCQGVQRPAALAVCSAGARSASRRSAGTRVPRPAQPPFAGASRSPGPRRRRSARAACGRRRRRRSRMRARSRLAPRPTVRVGGHLVAEGALGNERGGHFLGAGWVGTGFGGVWQLPRLGVIS